MRLHFIPIFICMSYYLQEKVYNKKNLSNNSCDCSTYMKQTLEVRRRIGNYKGIAYTFNIEIFKKLFYTYPIRFIENILIGGLNISTGSYEITFPGKRGIAVILNFFDDENKRKYTKL